MEQFAVFHLEKGKGNLSGLGSHIDRTRIPKNADPEKQILNEHLFGKETLTKDINKRIAEAGSKVRADSVKALSIVLTGSHERMKEIEGNSKMLKAWKEENLKFLVERFGEKNLMRFSLHMDERTPHIHAVLVPITNDGRLNAKEIVGGPKGLKELQDQYAKRMEQFGLKRGLENSAAKHEDVREYYARVNNPTGKLERDFSIPEREVFESNKTYRERIAKELTPFIEELHQLRRKSGNEKERAAQAEKKAETALKLGRKAVMEEKAKVVAEINAELKKQGLLAKPNIEDGKIVWSIENLPISKPKENLQKLPKNRL